MSSSGSDTHYQRVWLVEAHALMHQLAKDLSWIRRLARRMEAASSEPGDASAIRTLSEEMRQSLSSFMKSSARAERVEPTMTPVAFIVWRAIRATSRLHGPGRVSTDIATAALARCADARLEVVLINVLDNALHASSAPCVLEMEIQSDRTLQVRVTDSGPGMDLETREACCNPGFTTRAADGGHGVGLAVSKRLAANMGAALEIDSSPGEGTVVSICGLPTRPRLSASPSLNI